MKQTIDPKYEMIRVETRPTSKYYGMIIPSGLDIIPLGDVSTGYKGKLEGCRIVEYKRKNNLE